MSQLCLTGLRAGLCGLMGAPLEQEKRGDGEKNKNNSHTHTLMRIQKKKGDSMVTASWTTCQADLMWFSFTQSRLCVTKQVAVLSLQS